MQIKYYTISERDKWDAFVAQESEFALLQSWGWGEFKEKTGWKVFRIAVEERGKVMAGAQILVKPLIPNLASVAYIPRGPLGNWLQEHVAGVLLSEFHRISKLHKVVFLKIEPPLVSDAATIRLLNGFRFLSTQLYNQPSATIIMDLKPSLDEIMGQMRSRTREYIRYSERKGVKVRVGGLDDLPEFARLMQNTAQREHFAPRTRAYYKDEWMTFNDLGQTVLLMASYRDKILAVHMAFRFGGHAAYFHGGSLRDFAELRPNYLLMWEAIKWAKGQGCRTFDLWGIPSEVGWAVAQGEESPVSERADDLWGVYRFKRGFSKNVVAYVGSWDYVYNPIIYPLITNRFLNVTSVDGILALIDSVR